MSKVKNSISHGNRFLRRSILAILLALGIAASTNQASAAESVKFNITIARASSSPGDVDKRLIFAKKDLLGTGYKSFAYIRSHLVILTKGKVEKFSVAPGISCRMQLEGVLGPRSNRVQYSLTFYARKKKPTRIKWAVSKNGRPGINCLRQDRGSAYVVIVRALK